MKCRFGELDCPLEKKPDTDACQACAGIKLAEATEKSSEIQGESSKMQREILRIQSIVSIAPILAQGLIKDEKLEEKVDEKLKKIMEEWVAE